MFPQRSLQFVPVNVYDPGPIRAGEMLNVICLVLAGVPLQLFAVIVTVLPGIVKSEFCNVAQSINSEKNTFTVEALAQLSTVALVMVGGVLSVTATEPLLF